MLTELSIQDLTSLLEQYPWFASARKELCRRLFATEDEAWRLSQYAEHLVYMPSRSAFYDFMQSVPKVSLEKPEEHVTTGSSSRVLPGDFFSEEAYKNLEGNFVPVFQFTGTPSKSEEAPLGDEIDFCTETLAEIYIEQGYFDQAKQIYSKLLLANPEKSVYFASLIEKIDNLDKQ